MADLGDTAEPRLSSAFLVSTLIRRCQQQGGFAAVLHRGDADAGAILIAGRDGPTSGAVLERGSDLSGRTIWRIARPAESPVSPREGQQQVSDNVVYSNPPLSETLQNQYLVNRIGRDRDIWVIELDIPDVERFAAESIAVS